MGSERRCCALRHKDKDGEDESGTQAKHSKLDSTQVRACQRKKQTAVRHPVQPMVRGCRLQRTRRNAPAAAPQEASQRAGTAQRKGARTDPQDRGCPRKRDAHPLPASPCPSSHDSFGGQARTTVAAHVHRDQTRLRARGPFQAQRIPSAEDRYFGRHPALKILSSRSQISMKGKPRDSRPTSHLTQRTTTSVAAQ